MKKLLKNEMIFLWLAAILGTYGIGYVTRIVADNAYTNSIFTLGTAVLLFFIWKPVMQKLDAIEDKKLRRRKLWYAAILSFFFALCLICGYQLKIWGMTSCGLRGKSMIFLRSICLSCAVFPFANILFDWADKMVAGSRNIEGCSWRKGYVYLISFAGIFLLWIPVFMAYYPAIMSYDFHRQSQEAMKGFIWFNSYQPLAHTWLIWLFLHWGEALGSYETGMALYSIFQMLVLAAAYAYSCNIVYRVTKKRWPVILLVLFYGLHPYHSILSVGATKDVIFTALFVVFVCLFIERTLFARGRKQLIMDILWVAEGIFMILFRNNAVYAIAVFAVFFVIMAERKQKLRVLIMCILLAVGGKGALEGMQVIIGTEGRGSQSEMFSVPIQQFARVGHFCADSLSLEEYDMINRFVPAEYWPDYNPPLSDTVKFKIAVCHYNDTWKGHLPEMFSAWFKIGMKYPNEYVDAFLLLNSGYWFLDDVSFAEVFGYGTEDRMGALSTYNSAMSEVLPNGIAHESKFPFWEKVLEKIVSDNIFYQWPIASSLFKTALYCWGILIMSILFLYGKQKKQLLISLFPLIYLGTMFLGPVVQVRYVLPLMAVVPLLISLIVYKDKQ